MKQWKSERWHLLALYNLFWVGGILAVVSVLQHPSESSFLFGYSLPRLVAASVGLGLIILLMAVSAAEVRLPDWWKVTRRRLSTLVDHPRIGFALFACLFTGFLGISAVLLLALSPAALELTELKTIWNTFGVLLIWFAAVLFAAGMVVSDHAGVRGRRVHFFSPFRLAVLFAIFTVVYTVTLRQFMMLTWDIRMRGVEQYIFLPAMVFLLWGGLHQAGQARAWYPAFSRWLLLAALGLTIYALYRHTAQWMEWQFTPSKAYWHELADAFLHGKLYLLTPGSYHDLTFYQGHWYVPNPPLPAFVFLPLVAIWGVANINTVVVSIGISAITVVLIYLALEQASRRGLIPTGLQSNLVLTILFAFGTSFWWLSILGRMWFISQILTLTFSTLALLCVLYNRSPWWVGASLGLAVLSRPNAFTVWPLLAGVALYLRYQFHGKTDWWWALRWAVQSAVPVCLAAVGLLFYNHLRFDNFFDFGYVTINGADWIVKAVQTYGIFHVHFVPENLFTMLFKLPVLEMRGSCLYFSPTREGISVFALTPALLFMFRRFRKNWWTVGAWLSVLLSVGLLLLYHNNGAWQVGYRYLMDFILPVLLLVAVGIGRKPSRLFYAMTAVSILVTLAGILWWFMKWWC